MHVIKLKQEAQQQDLYFVKRPIQMDILGTSNYLIMKRKISERVMKIGSVGIIYDTHS